MSGISKMERDSIRERVKDGIQAKKLANEFKKGGRPKGTTENDAAVLKKYSKW
jgi:DNA invertase Pin-like site-specific DNA recombinase